MVVANIEYAEHIPNSFADDLQRKLAGGISDGLPPSLTDQSVDDKGGSTRRVLNAENITWPFCISLGPSDGIFVNKMGFTEEILLQGKSAAMQKQLIEDVKLAAMREESTIAKVILAPFH